MIKKIIATRILGKQADRLAERGTGSELYRVVKPSGSAIRVLALLVRPALLVFGKYCFGTYRLSDIFRGFT